MSGKQSQRVSCGESGTYTVIDAPRPGGRCLGWAEKKTAEEQLAESGLCPA